MYTYTNIDIDIHLFCNAFCFSLHFCTAPNIPISQQPNSPIAPPISQYPNIPNIPMSKYPNIPRSQHPNVYLSQYPKIPVSQYPNVPISQCTNIQISQQSHSPTSKTNFFNFPDWVLGQFGTLISWCFCVVVRGSVSVMS